MRAKRTRRWHISKSTSRGVCNGVVTLAPGWANAGRGHADAHEQRLPCSEVLQRRSSKDGFKKAALGGSLTTGRHKDISGVLSKWREVVKDGVAPDSCTADLVAFLQRKNPHH
jgi:hypothetical protein